MTRAGWLHGSPAPITAADVADMIGLLESMKKHDGLFMESTPIAAAIAMLRILAPTEPSAPRDRTPSPEAVQPPETATAPPERPSWAYRYMITSRTGRVYSRREVYNSCARKLGAGNGPGIRALLDSPGFMRPLSGTVPSAVVRAVMDALLDRGALVVSG